MPKGLKNPDSTETIVASRDRPELKRKKIEDLGKGQRQQREVDIASPERQVSDHHSAYRRGKSTPQHCHPQGCIELHDEEPRGVSPQSIKGRVSEGELSGKPEQDVEPGREESDDQDIRRDGLIGREKRENDQDGDGYPELPVYGSRQWIDSRFLLPPHPSPKSPAFVVRRTMAIRIKMATVPAWG